MPPKTLKKTDEPPKTLLGRPKGNLKMGLVGLPNVGKSTTFNLLCKQSVPAENYPFCTIDPHEARMNVPDERFRWLCENFKPKSEVPANLAIFDIAGLVPGAHKGEGLGNAFLSHIQGVDGIYHVVRAFDDDEVTHSEGEVHPVKDLTTIYDELRQKDLDRLTKFLEDKSRARQGQQDKQKAKEFELLQQVLAHLQSGQWISAGAWKGDIVDVLNDWQFLTAKPVVYLVNMSPHDFARQKNKWLPKIAAWVKEKLDGPIIPFSAAFESKLADLETEEEKKAFMQELGVSKSQIGKIISTGYSSLNLIHFFTCGEDEVRCWTIRQGTKAPQAAGAIHTDFEKGFICADVYKFSDIKEFKTEAALKAHGKIMQKGKDYVVEDGDCIFFKFNPSGGKK